MNFTNKLLAAFAVLLGIGAVARLAVPGSNSYDAGETVGMFLGSALLIAIAMYLRGLTRKPSVEPATDIGANSTKKSWEFPFWALLALLVSGMGASASGHGLIPFLFAFAVFGAVFWLMEKALRAFWRRATKRHRPSA